MKSFLLIFAIIAVVIVNATAQIDHVARIQRIHDENNDLCAQLGERDAELTNCRLEAS